MSLRCVPGTHATIAPNQSIRIVVISAERYRTGMGDDVLVRQGWHRVEHVRPIEGTEIKGPENP